MRHIFVLLLAAIAASGLAVGQTVYPYVTSTLAGTNPLGDGGPATAALLEYPQSVALQNGGNILVADSYNNRIRSISPNGIINTIVRGYVADLKTDAAGNIYATDGLYQIYKITTAGAITVIAGAGPGYSDAGGVAKSALFLLPQGIALDIAGNVYVADTLNCVIRKITPDGKISTIAGDGNPGYGNDNVPAVQTQLALPQSVAVDATGNVYIGDMYRIRKVSPTGIITTIAGDFGNKPVDGPAVSTSIGPTVGMTIDSSGNLYLADQAFNLIRVITTDKLIKTLAGTGTAGFLGDGGPALAARLNGPIGVAVDASGNVFFADEFNQRIRKIDTSGVISTIAGKSHFAGDNGPATAGLLHLPEHAVTDAAGNLYVSDSYNNRIRKVTPSGTITTFAGTGGCDYGGDHGRATAAFLCLPKGMAFDTAGNLYVAEWYNNVIRRIDPTGVITTFAGTGAYGDTGDGGPATAAQFKGPFGLAFDGSGNLFVSDNVAHRVRKISGGTITTVVGTGSSGSTGDNGPSSAATLDTPQGIAVSPDGSLFISDGGNHRVRKVSNGVISTVAGMQTCCATGSKGTANYLGKPDGLLVDAALNVYTAWPEYGVITKLAPNGDLTTIAGTGDVDFLGDGDLSTHTAFNYPSGLWMDGPGDIYVADQRNNRVRKLTVNLPTSVTISSGDGQSGTVGTALQVRLKVTVNFRGGFALGGVPVTFAVTSGSATLSNASTATDLTGSAGADVTLGSTPGAVVITVTAATLSPVQFHLTANPSGPIVPVPTISSGGITGAGGSTPPITQLSPGGLASIFGSNFAAAGTAVVVQTTDLVNSSLPTKLANTCVQVGTALGFLTFVGAGQINFQVPDVPVNSTVNVQVLANCGATNEIRSAVVAVQTQAATPEFLYWLRNANGANPIVAVNAVSGAYVGASGLIPGLTFIPAKPGDVLTVYCISLGPTNPAVAHGLPSAGAAPTVSTPVVKMGTSTLDAANVLYAGASPGTAGLYQLNITVPNLPDGDYPLTLALGTFSTPSTGYITVKN